LVNFSTRTNIEAHNAEQGMSQDIRRLFSRRQVTDHLQEIEGVQGQIQRDYMEAVREFRNDEYRDSIRDIGTASEDYSGVNFMI